MMTPDRSLAAAIAGMVDRFDIADTLAQLLAACGRAYPSDAVAILVVDERGDLELLSSSSHRADELELLQIQSELGPCVESLARAEPVFAVGRDELVERWGEVGSAIVAAGYAEAHAFPMHWRSQVIGGLNIFVREGHETDRSLGQMYADLATLAVLQTREITSDQLVARLHEAVSSRAVIEQAKGVLAYRHGEDMQSAYDRLTDLAGLAGTSLTAAARDVIERAHRPPTASRSQDG